MEVNTPYEGQTVVMVAAESGSNKEVVDLIIELVGPNIMRNGIAERFSTFSTPPKEQSNRSWLRVESLICLQCSLVWDESFLIWFDVAVI